MNNVSQFALNLIQNNPNVSRNPLAKDYISVIQNGDDTAGQMLANNICATYGLTREQAVEQARKFFHI